MRYFLLCALLLVIIPAVAAHDTGEPHLELPPGVLQVLETQTELALSVNFLIAFLAGIIGFVSPCSFVVFPAFFAFVFKERKRAVFMTAAFTLGIIVSFIMMGIAAGLVGTFFNEIKREFAWLSGILLIAFGVLMLLNKGFTFLTFKMDHPDRKRSFMSMAVLGFFFALGWTPCVGPILAGILVLAANTGAVLTSAMMLFAYGVGVAVPLLLVAWLSDKYDFARWMQRGHLQFRLFGKTVHTHVYNIVGGLLLIGVGVVIFAYRGSQEIERVIVEFTPWKMNWLYSFNDAVLASPLTSGIANIVGIIVLFGIIYLVWRALRRPDRAAKFK